MARRIDDTGFGGVRVIQDPEAFCYGTDAVLLAHMAATHTPGKPDYIMDLGTGNGIVPLILSNKTPSGHIYGLEVQREMYELAKDSIALNGLEGRLDFFHGNVKDVPRMGFVPPGKSELKEAFDVVTSNPPYTAGSRGIMSSAGPKAIARHEIEGTLDDFLKAAAYLLKDKGHFYMVHRPNRLVDICEGCRKYKLEPKEMQFISGKQGEKPNILLVHCTKNGGPGLNFLDPIYVREEDGRFSEDMRQAYR